MVFNHDYTSSEKIGKTIRYRKLIWDNKSVTLTTKDNFEVTGIKLNLFTQSSEVTTIMHLFERTNGTRYGLIIGRYCHQGTGINFLNGTLYSTWNELRVPLLDMRYWNDTIIGDCQCYRSMIYPEEYNAH